jgi:2-hydroxychromene-2-carboxylate isomerase
LLSAPGSNRRPARLTLASNLEFYFDLGSPPSYIAHARLPSLGADVILRPVLAGGVFKLTQNRPPLEVPAKRDYMLHTDLPRSARRYGIPLSFHANAPVPTLALMRGAVVAEELGRLADYVEAMYRAMWAEARDMSDPQAVGEALGRAGFDAAALFAWTQAAVDRGVFGVPTFFLDDEMFFGQDRLALIEERL